MFSVTWKSYATLTFFPLKPPTERTSRITFSWIIFENFLKAARTLFKYPTQNDGILKIVYFV